MSVHTTFRLTKLPLPVAAPLSLSDTADLNYSILRYFVCQRTPLQLLIRNAPDMPLLLRNSVSGVRKHASMAKITQITSSESDASQQDDRYTVEAASHLPKQKAATLQ
ncbi:MULTISPECIES: hypothetical protein [Paenibacillus]|uniref:hypothetical protein n=1 Tax=unclassified Paenibacillus TaxID=185978 RepID=UPI0011815485